MGLGLNISSKIVNVIVIIALPLASLAIYVHLHCILKNPPFGSQVAILNCCFPTKATNHNSWFALTHSRGHRHWTYQHHSSRPCSHQYMYKRSPDRCHSGNMCRHFHNPHWCTPRKLANERNWYKNNLIIHVPMINILHINRRAILQCIYFYVFGSHCMDIYDLGKVIYPVLHSKNAV